MISSLFPMMSSAVYLSGNTPATAVRSHSAHVYVEQNRPLYVA